MVTGLTNSEGMAALKTKREETHGTVLARIHARSVEWLRQRAGPWVAGCAGLWRHLVVTKTNLSLAPLEGDGGKTRVSLAGLHACAGRALPCGSSFTAQSSSGGQILPSLIRYGMTVPSPSNSPIYELCDRGYYTTPRNLSFFTCEMGYFTGCDRGGAKCSSQGLARSKSRMEVGQSWRGYLRPNGCQLVRTCLAGTESRLLPLSPTKGSGAGLLSVPPQDHVYS